jgi:type IV secretion system protein VirD4
VADLDNILKEARQKHGWPVALRLTARLALQSPEFRRSLPGFRLLKGACFVAWLLISAVLSVSFGMRLLDDSSSAWTATFRYGWFAVPLWLFPISLIVWAFYASENLFRSGRAKKPEVGKAANGVLGHARIATSDDLRRARLIGKHAPYGTGIRLGFDKESGEVIRYTPRDGHGLIVAPTGSGKNRDFLTAALLEWQGSCIVIDPKGALCAITQRHRRSLNNGKGKVIVLNPFENDTDLFPMTLPTSSTYNPMALLNQDAPGFTIACERLASGIVGDDKTEGQENAAHFRDRARNLIAGIIMHVAAKRPKGDRNLAKVRDVITCSNGENLFVFAEEAIQPGATQYVQQKLARYAEDGAKDSKEVADVLSTAERYTDFIGNETIDPYLRGDGFRFHDAKNVVTTIYVILPMEHMTTCGKWFRLIVASALHELWRKGRGNVPVLMMLDEFAQFGSLSIVQAAMNTARNYGIQLLPVLQQLSDLEGLYGRQWGSFVNGAAFKMFFASDDLTTRDYVEKLSGITTVPVPSSSFTTPSGWGGGPGTANMGIGYHAQPLKAGYEVGEIPRDEFLLKVTGLNIIEGKRYKYDDEEHCRDLAGMWDRDPYEDRAAETN